MIIGTTPNRKSHEPLYIPYDIISKYIGQNFSKIKETDESTVLIGLTALFEITRSSCQTRSEDVETLSNQ